MANRHSRSFCQSEIHQGSFDLIISSRQETQIQPDGVDSSCSVPPKYRSKICVVMVVRVQYLLADDSGLELGACELSVEVSEYAV